MKTMKQCIIIEAMCNGYALDQCGETLTVGELIDLLGEYDEDTPVYLSHDEGYTYGNITPYHIDCDTKEFYEDEE